MLRRLFTSQKRSVSAPRPFVRLHLEQLEKREVPDASLGLGLTMMALSAYQTAQQMQQIQGATQTALTQYYSDVASYTAGKGVPYAQVAQDMATLQQDASNIQALNSTFQTDSELFAVFLMIQMGDPSSDGGQLFTAAYRLGQGQSIANSALQTAAEASSVSSASSVPTSPASKPVETLSFSPFTLNLSGVSLQEGGFQVAIFAQQGGGLSQQDIVSVINSEVASLKQVVNQWLGQLRQVLSEPALANPASTG
jgi:hypothetical protein